MSETTRLLCGITLLTIPSIAYGGWFLLSILSGKQEKLALTPYQKAMFRAGHAHAGVLVILSLIGQLLADHANLPTAWVWLARVALPLSAVLISGGFFGAAAGPGRTRPGPLIKLLYVGVFLLVVGLGVLGIGLIR